MTERECPDCGEPMAVVEKDQALPMEAWEPLLVAPDDGWICADCGLYMTAGAELDNEGEPL